MDMIQNEEIIRTRGWVYEIWSAMMPICMMRRKFFFFDYDETTSYMHDKGENLSSLTMRKLYIYIEWEETSG